MLKRPGLTIFFNTCLALHSQNTHRPVKGIADHEMRGEKCVFAGYVSDGHGLLTYKNQVGKSGMTATFTLCVYIGTITRR